MSKHFVALSILGLLAVGSCKKSFLEKAPGVDLTEENAFQSQAAFNQFLTVIYRYSMHSVLRYRDANTLSTTVGAGNQMVHPNSAITDEGEASEADFLAVQFWNSAAIAPQNIVEREDARYYIRWIALRQIAITLSRIDELPGTGLESYKRQIKAEMKVLRAMNYLEMLKRYGGVPIVDQVFQPGQVINVPRGSVEEVVNFIVKDCNEAIAESALPAITSSADRGRVTKAVAYTVKAKTLLYAASPLFNSATPYLSMPEGTNNKMISYGNTDNNRWKLAADAAKEALDFVLTNGYSLVDVSAQRNPTDPLNGTVAAVGNYRNSWEQPNNSESILQYQGIAANALLFGTPHSLINPRVYGGNWSGITMTLNFLRKYEKLDGTPQTWDAAGGNNLLAKYAELDPRFKQTVTYTNSYYNSAHPISQIYNGGIHYVGCLGGTWIRKMLPGNANVTSTVLNDIVYRVNELYLYYAEAQNEFAGPSASASVGMPMTPAQAINTIRTRSGMPNLPAGLTRDQFRQRLRNEFDVEMMFDDHRLWNIRRWMIAEQDGVMQGAMQGLQITRNGTAPNFTYSWLPYAFENRTFTRNLYLHPFPLGEVLKGNLVQNPGYQ